MFQNCIRCTICVENCPVFGVNPHFPGPKQAGPDAQRFRLNGEGAVDDWVRDCCLCRRCETACPYGVDVADIILRAQIKYRQENGGSFASTLFSHNYVLGKMASLTAPIFNRLAARHWAKRLSAKMGISTHLPFPEFRFFSLRGGLPLGLRRFDRSKKRVAFFHGCHLNFNRPDIGRKIRLLLMAAGLDVAVPHQLCCGLPALGNGNLRTARMYAARNAATLSSYIDAGYDIVYACTSCGLTLTNEYPGVLDLPEGKKIAENSYNVYEYILNLPEADETVRNLGELREKIVYFASCHLKASGIGYPAARMLAMIPGLECEVIDDRCCGLAGSFGFKKANQEVSRAIGEKAAHAVKQTGADALVAECGACRMQLGHLAEIPALDPSEIITKSLVTSGILPLKRSLYFR